MYIIVIGLFLLLDFFHYLEKCKNKFYYYKEKVDGIGSKDSCEYNKYITI